MRFPNFHIAYSGRLEVGQFDQRELNETVNVPEDIQAVYDKATCLYSKAEVEAALDRMAEAIDKQLHQSNPVFLCIMLGAMVPLSHLLLRLDFPLELDYIHVTRYHGKTKASDIRWKVKPATKLKDRTVIIVDDILDSGLTMQAVIDYCKAQGAKEVYCAVLIDKKTARHPKGYQKADFAGLEAENRYVFGFGLDYKEYLRNAPGIYAISSEYE